jgi:hypothetical protein
MTNIQAQNNSQNTQVNSDLKASASGGELRKKQIFKGKKKKHAKSEKSIAARKDLKERSQLAKKARTKAGKEELPLNVFIIADYQADTGAQQFKTFGEWKKEGFKVKKGESGFPVWGTPKKITETVETEDGEKLESDPYEFWPMAYLFNETQVEKIELVTD